MQEQRFDDEVELWYANSTSLHDERDVAPDIVDPEKAPEKRGGDTNHQDVGRPILE
jgi:hypothetical protein